MGVERAMLSSEKLLERIERDKREVVIVNIIDELTPDYLKVEKLVRKMFPGESIPIIPTKRKKLGKKLEVLSSQFNKAAIIGDSEVQTLSFNLKDLETHQQTTIKFEDEP